MSTDDDMTRADIDAAAQGIIDCDPEELARAAEKDPELFAALAKVLERALLDTSRRPRVACTRRRSGRCSRTGRTASAGSGSGEGQCNLATGPVEPVYIHEPMEVSLDSSTCPALLGPPHERSSLPQLRDARSEGLPRSRRSGTAGP